MFFGEEGDDDDHHVSFQDDPFLFTVYLVTCMALVLMAGLMSGLTLGLMSLDTVELEVLKRTGKPDERRYASIIMPVVSNQHLLLVTLLLCNACATEALPLFLDRLADPISAVLISVTMVLIFGEVLPQAVCSRYGLLIGAYSAWFVRLLMIVTAPISWPIARVLDLMLGSQHSALFRRAQLKALVDVHGTLAGFGGTLSENEIHIISGALDMTHKMAAKSMTPLEKVFMLSTADKLDERCLQSVLLAGHSRIPVYNQGNRRDIVGLILAKELILVDPAGDKHVRDLCTRSMPRVSAKTPMYDLLSLFQTGNSHMALVVKPANTGSAISDSGLAGAHQSLANSKGNVTKSLHSGSTSMFKAKPRPDVAVNMGPPTEEVIGVITLEDVIEELLQDEIVDEMDMYVDNLQTSRVSGAHISGSLPPRLKTILNSGAFTPRIGRLAMPFRQMPASWSPDG